MVLLRQWQNNRNGLIGGAETPWPWCVSLLGLYKPGLVLIAYNQSLTLQSLASLGCTATTQLRWSRMKWHAARAHHVSQ